MLKLQGVDLNVDPLAQTWFKHEIVSVRFAPADGELMSGVGANRYRAGDALITGADGDSWSVTRMRFDDSYEPVAPLRRGAPGQYRNVPRPVLARQMTVDFTCQRSAGSDWLSGKPGDWLLQYAPGDYGIAAAARFARVYRQ